MFRRTRERFEGIERALNALAAKLDVAPAGPAAPPATDAIAKLLGTMMTSNVDLVGAMGDLAVRSVARRNGIRGGTRNAQAASRDREGKFLPKNRRERRSEPACKLCQFGEGYPGVTIPMIQAHRAHLEAREPGSTRGEHDRFEESHQSDESDGSGSYRNGSAPEPGN